MSAAGIPFRFLGFLDIKTDGVLISRGTGGTRVVLALYSIFVVLNSFNLPSTLHLPVNIVNIGLGSEIYLFDIGSDIMAGP